MRVCYCYILETLSCIQRTYVEELTHGSNLSPSFTFIVIYEIHGGTYFLKTIKRRVIYESLS